MYICMYVCMYACMHACMHVYIYICASTMHVLPLCASRSLMVLSLALLQVDDNWAECDLCQKWRRLPGTFVVADGAHFQCSDADRSCEDPEGLVLSLSLSRALSLWC